MAKLGDMVCTTPAFRAIKRKYPHAKLYVVGDAINEKVLSGNPDVDHYIVGNDANLFEVAKKLRKEKIDFGCTTGPSFASLLALIFSGSRSIATYKILGGRANQTRTYKFLQQFVLSVPYTFGEYLPRTHLRLLEPAGIFAEDTTKYLYFTKEASERIDRLFAEHGIAKKDFVVGMSPAAGHRVKEWPAERFGKIASYLYKKYNATIVVVGGPNDKKEAQIVMDNVEQGVKVINTAGELSIEELKALASRLKLFISVDTGTIYVSEAFNVPTIDIAGPIHINEQPPRGKIHRSIVPKIMERVLLFAMNVRDYDFAEVRKQVESITPEMVEEVIDELIASNPDVFKGVA